MKRSTLAKIACLLALAFTGCASQHMVDITPTPTNNSTPTPAAAKSVAGKWTAQFDSQLGPQTYTFDLKLDGATLSGTAIGQTGTDPARDPIVLIECKLDGSAIHFVEPRDFNGTPMRIEYTGTVTGDTMQLKRAVGDIATSEAVAKRIAN